MHINTVFAELNQLNVGPEDGFMIEDESASWDDYITTMNAQMVKSYIYLKVRLLFDPPSSGILVDSINRQISELEWRLYIDSCE